MIENFTGRQIECELPNASIYTMSGSLKDGDDIDSMIPIDID